MKTAEDMYLRELISDLYNIAKSCKSSNIESSAKRFDEYITEHNSNVFEYKIATKTVELLNEFLDTVYDYTVSHYGKDFADKWLSAKYIHADADRLYNRLMKTVCF